MTKGLAAALLAVVAPIAARRCPEKALVLSATDIVLERPRNRDHGDWASSIAMKIAKRLGADPYELAREIAEELASADGIASVQVAGPGFINIRVEAGAAGALAKTIVEAGAAFGTNTSRADEIINLEFVSANPTGPIHLGGTRWAAVGDALARILASQGAQVTREYYFNDHGAQIDRFARSLVAAHEGRPTPEDGYGGGYIDDIARRVALAYQGDIDELEPAAKQEAFREIGVGFMFDEIKQSLHEFGVDFDVYFHEDSLHASGAVDRAVDELRTLGHLYDKDGAVWLRTTEFGDDKDRVVIKSDGNPAYVAGDLAYYLDKRERGFTLCIYMLGADHHGYIARLKAAAAALGDDPATVEVLIGQMVNLVRDGQPVRMSKRAGTVITLDDLVDAIGVDAARYVLIRSSVNSPIDIDLGLWASASNENPVYYVQYAHARLSALARSAAELGLSADTSHLDLLTHDREATLMRNLGEFGRILKTAATLREPHRVCRYLEDLAGDYHRFYDSCRVLPQGDEDPTDLNAARLALCEATRQTIANGLAILGVSAPERM